ncbi:GNAT family N-acetyltransferase [Saccharopolyspora sp. K220]|uniref:GNAT family N-acetyltransferase n=1 Tax=Saccharopolyspora soli TaxID=2926618 RepID=UPI001F5701D9|nr:GNAT family N-acetyltransferase [Saccharopolyspora soli]MCI2418838.1 GNAT family N-acetyltransferase [Saccharopolyspora soli]
MPAATNGTAVLDRLTAADAGEVLTLQRAAYVTEAQSHDDVRMPPLTETLDEIRDELARSSCLAWGCREAGRLVAAVRVALGETAAGLGRLVVAPDRQGHGLGTGLLRHVEQHLPARIETINLFTGEHSTANLRLYRRLGYQETHRTSAGDYQLIHFRKALR